MKSMIVVCVIALAAFVGADTYTDKFDNTNVEEIVQNHRLLVSYIKCLLGQAPCTSEGKELKTHIKEAIENHCGKCTEVQKMKTRVILRHLINHEVDYWNQLVAFYDPDMKHSKKYENELKELKAH